MSWLSLPIRRDADVVAVRSRVRALATALPLSDRARNRVIAAASELARCTAATNDGSVTFGWDDVARVPWVEFIGSTAPPADVLALIARLESSELVVERMQDGSRAQTLLRIHPRAGEGIEPEPLRELLLRGEDATAIELLREQNREMARLLDELHAREEALAGALERARYAANEAAVNALRIQELARRKDEVLAVVSHDIRSPLAAVRGALSILEGSLGQHLDEDQRRLIAIARRAGDNIVDLVANVLTAALMDTGDSAYEPVAVDLSQLTNETVGTLEIPATQKSLRLEADIQSDVRVPGEPTWLRQVVTNLVMNAIKFTDKGGTVTVRLARVDASGVRLEVADTGVGIPATKRTQVFEKLRKLRGGTAGERGTGLGLYITRKLVDRMGGSIDFDSEEGRGTTFTVQLPVDARTGGGNATQPA